MKGIYTEASERAKRKAKVKLFIFHKNLLLVLIEDSKDKCLNLLFIEWIKTSDWKQ
ncbi:hypothetical protein D3C79_1058730 [compost metagenome]